MEQTLEIALIQSPLHWENPEANRKMFSEKIATLQENVDLVVLPEMFTTGFTMNPHHLDRDEGSRTLAWMLENARTNKVAIIGSVIFQEQEAFFNRLFAVFPDGSHYQYDKRHTFTLAGEHKVYRAGTSKLLFEYKGFTFCPLICYDLRFPVWARNVEAYDVLMYVANWPRPRISAWDTLLKARAIENMAYCIGVNRIGQDELGYEYPGHSSVYDTLGNQLVFSEKEEVLFTALSKTHINTNREKLRFLEDRDQFNLL